MKQPADTINVTIIQSALQWEDKQANLANFERVIRSYGNKLEVVVLPEMFSTGFSMNAKHLAETMDGPTVSWMKRISAENKIILTGSVIIEEGGNFFNRLIWMLPNGEMGVYDKRHLFAYAGEDDHFSPGSKRLIASVKGWKFNLQVCYDLRFPIWARQQTEIAPVKDGGIEKSGRKDAGPEYDVLLYVANWPEKRSHAWKTLLMARAIENQCFTVGANRCGDDGSGIHYSGDSMIVSPMGEVMQSCGDSEGVLTVTLSAEALRAVREKLPFLKDADPFAIGR